MAAGQAQLTPRSPVIPQWHGEQQKEQGGRSVGAQVECIQGTVALPGDALYGMASLEVTQLLLEGVDILHGRGGRAEQHGWVSRELRAGSMGGIGESDRQAVGRDQGAHKGHGVVKQQTAGMCEQGGSRMACMGGQHGQSRMASQSPPKDAHVLQLGGLDIK